MYKRFRSTTLAIFHFSHFDYMHAFICCHILLDGVFDLIGEVQGFPKKTPISQKLRDILDQGLGKVK